MTHEELRAKIKLRRELTKWINAVNAVVELHKPVKVDNPDYSKYWFCDLCFDYTGQAIVEYPCPTIQAIEKELQ